MSSMAAGGRVPRRSAAAIAALVLLGGACAAAHEAPADPRVTSTAEARPADETAAGHVSSSCVAGASFASFAPSVRADILWLVHGEPRTAPSQAQVAGIQQRIAAEPDVFLNALTAWLREA